MNILISTSEKYLNFAETMLFSLKRNTEEAITVYLLNHNLSRDRITGFEQYLEELSGMSLSVIDVDPALFYGFPLGSYFSIENYYRILAQFILPEILDRILWLDADIIVLKDIGAFYHQSFDGMKYVVCPDNTTASWSYKIEIQKERLGIPDEHEYFNSGVMLMNLPLLRQETNIETILQRCLELKDKLLYADQDLLNALYVGQLKYADRKIYNNTISGRTKIPKEEAEQTAIFHYAGSNKPWDVSRMSNASKFYWKARWAQGHRLETVKSYAKAIGYLTSSYLHNVKNLFF